MYIKTIEPDEAKDDIAALYTSEIASMGRVMQATQCWSARADVIVPIESLLHQIRDGFSLGLLNFRLITLVAAKFVPSSYCSHVYFHSVSSMIGRDQALAVYRDFRKAGLSTQQVEMLAYAEQISRNASEITDKNIQRLRDVGFTDINIADIALAASYRNFMSRYFDAVGATIEPEFLDPDDEVRNEISVGRKS
ncbi:alkylhydroperoxidase [Rhizobium cauense]|uniref:carboxymuconolactone decarboxylase family protein n=1 Tax=Rhizobium cauense TaxID=1166683 RepID=UPI001C6E8869|nr:alkylhydroperoxidase [Rhizobium cauense]MBW9117386.1 alkylhydroperoxidase [Rhizobium cauense]